MAVTWRIMCVEEVVVALHGNAMIVVFGMMVGLVADIHLKVFAGHMVRLVVLVIEV